MVNVHIWHRCGSVPTISQEMFTLFDLWEVCSDEEKTRKFAEKHGLLKRKTPKCPDCDA